MTYKEAYELIKKEVSPNVFSQYFYTDEYFSFTVDNGGEWMSGVTGVIVDRNTGKIYRSLDDILKEKNIDKVVFKKQFKENCEEGIIEI